MKVKNIIFDFGGVLLNWNPRYYYHTYFEDEQEMEYFLSNICNDEWNAEQDKGRSFAEGIEKLQIQYPEYKEAINLYFEKWEDMLKSDLPETVQLLRELKALDYRIYGLTNWSAETIQIAYRTYDFFELFDGIVVSGEEKCIKPDKRIYNILLERYKLNAEESIFIDDNSANIQSAQELKFKGIVFDNIVSVKEQIMKFLQLCYCL